MSKKNKGLDKIFDTLKEPKNTLPFMPSDWKTRIPELVDKGSSSEWKNPELEKLCKLPQSSLKKHLKKRLKDMGYSPICGDGYLYAEGTIPVLLVAHMDTVHSELVSEIIYMNEYIISPQGIGGDDRAGIYIILQIIKELKCSVLFTQDEESGGVGATKFINAVFESKLALPSDIKYIVEFDRRGNQDAVFYGCSNKEFEEFIESTGYFLTNFGSYSDISEIAPALGVAAVNLSCGYYREHTKEEYINLKDVETIIKEAKKILEQHDKEYVYIGSRYGSLFDRIYYDTDDWYYADGSWRSISRNNAPIRMWQITYGIEGGYEDCCIVPGEDLYDAIDALYDQCDWIDISWITKVEEVEAL